MVKKREGLLVQHRETYQAISVGTETYVDACVVDEHRRRRNFCVGTIEERLKIRRSVKTRGDRVLV